MSEADPTMQFVQSSSIAAAGYDPRSRILRVRFVGGDTYDYHRVPAAVFRELLEAPSKGRFVNWQIKPRYAYRRVR
jgi:lysyl-tRNA synthetase class 2